METKELILMIVGLFLSILFALIIAAILIFLTNFISEILIEHIFNLNCGYQVYDSRCSFIIFGTSISLIFLSGFILMKTIKKIETSNKEDLKEKEK